MSDLIKREDAIDAVIEWYGCKPNDIKAFEKIIEAIPSAPTNKTKQVKYYDYDEMVWKIGEVIVNTLHDLTDSYKGSEYNGNIKD